MTRALYRGMVRLHPPAFRHEYGDEMLWIFEEASAAGTLALLGDALVSLARQWIIRYGAWKIAAGFVGGVFHMWLVFACLMLRPPLPKILPPPDAPCGSMMHECLALGPAPQRPIHKEDPCSNCETSPNATPESPR